MTDRTVTHATFCLERTYDATPARVFAAFATEEGKARWFSGPNEEWQIVERAFDFREGGRERLKGRWASGMVSDFSATYQDIVPDERIVYAYEMRQDDRKISVSLATLEFKPAGQGTRLVMTEQGAFLDGYDDAGSREHGTAILLDRVGQSLVERAEA
jgi:uncharacterized protein YndB with AHSA1/START domain